MDKKVLLVTDEQSTNQLSETAGSRFIKFTKKNRLNYRSFYLTKYSNNYKNLKQYLLNNDVDYIFFLLDPYIFYNYDFLINLKKKYFLIVFHADIDEHFQNNYVYSAQLYDLILVDEILEVNRYKLYNFNVEHFYFGFDKQNVDINKKDIDLSFVGRFDRYNRKELFSYLDSRNIKFQLFGKGSKNGIINHDKMKGIYNRSKIVLNLTSISEAIPYSHIKYRIRSKNKQVKGRPYEAMLSGCLVITEKTNGIKKIFPKETFIEAESNDEFYQKILYFLNNDNERIKIAKRGKEFAENNFIFEKALLNFENFLESHKKNSNTKQFIIDENYKSLIFKSMIHEILKSNLKNLKWSIYCVKRLKWRLLSIFDLISITYSYLLKLFGKIK